jgi:hypothetical protein
MAILLSPTSCPRKKPASQKPALVLTAEMPFVELFDVER